MVRAGNGVSSEGVGATRKVDVATSRIEGATGRLKSAAEELSVRRVAAENTTSEVSECSMDERITRVLDD